MIPNSNQIEKKKKTYLGSKIRKIEK